MAAPIFLVNALQYFQRLLKAPGREEAPGWGREVDIATSQSLFDGSNPDRLSQEKGLSAYTELAVNPYITAGLRYRDISHLWVSAQDIEAKKSGEDVENQLMMAGDEPLDRDVWAFISWNIDERLERGMKASLYQIQMSYLEYGYAVQELFWSPQPENTPWGKKTVLMDIKDRDSDRFIFNPPNRKPGLYLKRDIFSTTDLIPLSERRFCTFVNNARFENPYGRPETTPLQMTEFSLRNVSRFWDRHLERYGSPQLIHFYPTDRENDATWRANQLNALKKASHQAIYQISQRDRLEALVANGDAAGFETRLQMLIREISLVLCGDPTALLESKLGSFAKAEATTVRSRSNLEKQDAAILCDGFNYKILVWLADWNWMGLTRYPRLQLIPPENIKPITPEGQQPDQQPGQGQPYQVQGQGQGVETSSTTQTQPPSKENEQETPQEFYNANRIKKFAEELPPKEEEKPKAEETPAAPDMPTPPLYDDPTVIRYGKKFAKSQPVYAPDDFDKLPDSEKATAFTIQRISNPKCLEALQKAIRDTLPITDELTAWKQYQTKAIAIMQEYGVKPDVPGAGDVQVGELVTSFRVLRQNAYNEGIWQYAENLNRKGDLYGLKYHSQHDSDTRHNHMAMDGILRPIDDPIWQTIRPLNGFNCRCWVEPITKKQVEENPKQYQYTKALPGDAKPDAGFAEGSPLKGD